MDHFPPSEGVVADAPTFDQFNLPPAVVGELARQGIVAPFPIQAATIGDAMSGRDVLGKGRTGSGKTLAFSLPLIARLVESDQRRRAKSPRALVLVPTRELADQVCEVLDPLARAVHLRTTVIYGGVGYGKQIGALRDGVDIVVACPGRFVDHMESDNVRLDDVEITVLDEADHMADLGFLEDVKRILDQTPDDTQRLLFSATLDRGVDKVVRRYLHDPVTHEVADDDADESPMTHHFFRIDQNDRVPVIADLCAAPGKSLVFTRTKHGARKLAAALVKAGVPSVELHGDLSQSVRARNLAAFSGDKVDTLVATDIAARGIHVDDVALVIHADPPEEHKAFLHRSGRTARAGAAGTVITMVTDNMRRHVNRLAKDAGIAPEHHTVRPGDEVLTDVAPGDREFREMPDLEVRRTRPAQGGPSNKRRGPHRDNFSGPRRGGPSGRSDDGFRGERRDRPERNDRRDDRRDDFRDDRRDDRAPRGDRDDRRPRRDRDDRAPRRDRDDRAPRGDRSERRERVGAGTRSSSGERTGGPRTEWSPRPKQSRNQPARGAGRGQRPGKNRRNRDS
jgi:superfamily II DNA/RNA helicase